MTTGQQSPLERCINDRATLELVVAEYRTQVAELRRLVRMQEAIIRAAGLSPAANLKRTTRNDERPDTEPGDGFGGSAADERRKYLELAELRGSLERALDRTHTG